MENSALYLWFALLASSAIAMAAAKHAVRKVISVRARQ
jgi:hypothetical protein